MSDAPQTPPRRRLDLSRFDALLVDLDGVVTRTARVHARAWKGTFDELLETLGRRRGAPFRPFDPDADYATYVDGKPREDGIRSFLASRDVRLEDGAPDDPPASLTVHGVGHRKNERFRELLAREGVEVYPEAVDLVRRAKREGLAVAVVSSSRNCARVLAAAGLDGLFDVRVDGEELARLGLPGKPAPDMFLEAARRLGIAPARAALVEDAVAGVEAGRAGGFGLVIGIDRAGHGTSLAVHGADLVVSSLGDLDVGGRADRAPGGPLPSALEASTAIRQRILGKRVAVFLDYDGTLTPIVERPELALLSDAMRAAVAALAARCLVAVISGRARQDVQSLVGLGSVVYAGCHGFDIAGPAGMHVSREEGREFVPILAEAAGVLRAKLAALSGVWVEDKRYALAVHYRGARDADVPRVERAVDEVAGSFPALRRTSGKRVFELRPDVAWDKGRAVLWLLSALGLDGPDVVPFYLGDDVTDWDAFAALRDRGIGILVDGGGMETHATYRLEGPEQVRELLERMATWLEGAAA